MARRGRRRRLAVRTIAEMSWVGAENGASTDFSDPDYDRILACMTGPRRRSRGQRRYRGKRRGYAVTRETAIVAGRTAFALLITAMWTIAIARFALRPLGRLAAIAAEAANAAARP